MFRNIFTEKFQCLGTFCAIAGRSAGTSSITYNNSTYAFYFKSSTFVSYYILLFYTSAILSLSTLGLLFTQAPSNLRTSQEVGVGKLYLNEVLMIPFIIRSRCLKILVEIFKFRHLRKNSPIQFSTFPPISLVRWLPLLQKFLILKD